ncbi:MAG TPA: hypothetical protein DEA43_00395 [Candidatus Moranbacteria bacterium]|nr:hypothetical protein [Candidatus Moranbacteria bacterium]HBT45331.1 hypothetical protein [Candidatus Moranbacteria bacterium]
MKVDYKKILKFVLKLIVSSAFVIWLVFKIEWQEVFVYASKISLGYIVLYVAVLLLGMMISAWKWKMLLAHKDISISLKKSFQLYLTGAFINNFMPSTIGGDTYRAYQVGKETQKYSAVSSSVVFDRITGLFAVMLLTGVVAIFQWSEISKYPELRLAIIGVLIAMHGIILFGVLTRFSFWKKIAVKFPKIIQDFAQELVHYRQDNVYLKAIGISVLFSFVGLALVNWVLFSGLGITVGIMQYLSVIFLISIISALPISINNIGLKEWGYVTFFGFFGVSASAVVTVALLSRVLQMIVSFAALPAYLRSKKN